MKFFRQNILIISILLIFICCVSAASAVDIDGTDDVDDSMVINEVADIVEDAEVDEASDIVEDVKTGDASGNVVDYEIEDNVGDASDKVTGENLRSEIVITPDTYSQYFNETGYLTDDSDVWELKFMGDFNEVNESFGNFKINRFVTLNLADASFTNIGFDLMDSSLNLVGTNFYANENATNYAPIRIFADSVVVSHVNITVNAPEDRDYFAIDVINTTSVRLLNNIIAYNCAYANNVSYNYAIRAKNSSNINIIENTINATLPLKTVNWNLSAIDADYVAAVAIEKSNTTRFINNTLIVVGDRRVGPNPTLDALIIANSSYAHIEDNVIHENDIVSSDGSYSYIYGIDVYSCEGIQIKNNEIIMNGNESGWDTCGNGTGAAYGIQLSGRHDDVLVSWNNITSTNRGSNLGIYSQNYPEFNNTNLRIYRNIVNVTGHSASNQSWDLLSGIEIQDKTAGINENIVYVYDIEGYTEGHRVFGISYSQWINGTHDYHIYDNVVYVLDGEYAVYLLANTNVTGFVQSNGLMAHIFDSDNAAYAPTTNVNYNWRPPYIY